tara:strand:- start:230 stop:640 length:411 start_codon:yes stop_codon:yes gene_type:complete
MNMSLLVEELKHDEGVKFKPYQCSSGKLTIGIGRNIEERGISDSEAEFMLKNDIDICIDELKKAFSWYDNLSDKRQRVMINMCFNLGLGKLKGFKKFLQAMDDQIWNIAAEEMLDSRWADQVGDRAVRLALMVLEG